MNVCSFSRALSTSFRLITQMLCPRVRSRCRPSPSLSLPRLSLPRSYLKLGPPSFLSLSFLPPSLPPLLPKTLILSHRLQTLPP